MRRMWMLLLVLTMLLCTGCAMRTADELYRLPKRSEEYNDLQAAMDAAMYGLEYSAPISGDNQQTVQMADLDGDDEQEALLFARTADSKQLRILVFSMVDERYQVTATLETPGSVFEQVDYVPMDQEPGLEIVVGSRVSDSVQKALTVFGYRENGFQQLSPANYSYTKYLTCDLDSDGSVELFVLRPGMSEVDAGVAVWSRYVNGTFENSTEVNTSEPLDHLKRLMAGSLAGDIPGIYVASAVGEDAILTDVFALVGGKLTNITLSNDSGTSVETLRNYYVYGDDIDNDGIMELPDLVPLLDFSGEEADGRQSLIRWYAMTIQGAKLYKLYTYHNFLEGWYMEIEKGWVGGLGAVQTDEGSVEFYLREQPDDPVKLLLSVQLLTGDNRSAEAAEDNRIVLAKTDTVVYAATLEPAASELGLTRENLADRFHLIYMDWKTGET